MSGTLVTVLNASAGAIALLQDDVAAARRYADAEKASSTRRAYRSDVAIFAAWCASRGLEPMPATPGAVAAFLSAEAEGGAKASTLGRRCAAIRWAHEAAGHRSPTQDRAVASVMKGIRRTIGAAKDQKAAATADRIAGMLATIPDTLGGKRDRALLALGFSGAFRRSELVALTVADLEETAEGLRVTVRRSKTDQEGQGAVIAIPRGARLRVPDAVRAWLDAAGIVDGPVFRSVNRHGRVGAAALTDKVVALVVKRYAEAAGLVVADFSGHSLRAGFLTSAADAGASIFKMMDVSRHKSVDVLRGYVRRAEIFRDHAGSSFL